jgi:hypothetical protein
MTPKTRKFAVSKKLRNVIAGFGIYNVVGWGVAVPMFAVSSAFYFWLYPYLGAETWFAASILGGAATQTVEFIIIRYLNRRGKGIVFECDNAEMRRLNLKYKGHRRNQPS